MFDQTQNPGARLRADNLVAYAPPAQIRMTMYEGNRYKGLEKPVIADFTEMLPLSKYSAFLSGQSVLSVLENLDMEEDPSCIVVKDSCFVPYLTEHYKTIYAVDYRIYREKTLKALVEQQGIDDVIFAPYLIATQATDGNDFFKMICR